MVPLMVPLTFFGFGAEKTAAVPNRVTRVKTIRALKDGVRMMRWQVCFGFLVERNWPRLGNADARKVEGNYKLFLEARTFSINGGGVCESRSVIGRSKRFTFITIGLVQRLPILENLRDVLW